MDFLVSLSQSVPGWLWVTFGAIVLVALFVDFVVLNKQGSHRVTYKEALIWSGIWVAVSLVFNGLLWYAYSPQGSDVANTKALEYLTGYLVEKALALDNIFVFLMVFSTFAIPDVLQKRALMIGVIGAIVLRTLLILVGGALLQQFHFLLYLFGAFLLYTGYAMLKKKAEEGETNGVVQWIQSKIPSTPTLHGEAMWVRNDLGKWLATPLFLAVVCIAIVDVIFAVDSIPAIYAITSDPFIVLTSNIFAILGLRALYFLLADLANRFAYLQTGLALVLMFVGSKMLLVDVYKVPVVVSLLVIVATLGISIAYSWYKSNDARLKVVSKGPHVHE